MRPVRDRLEGDPPAMALQKTLGNNVSDIRNLPGEAMKERLKREGILIDTEQRNLGNGVLIGALEAGTALILEDVLGVPFGATVDVLESEKIDENTERYTVNVNAPTKNMAEVRAFLDSGTGFTSLLTEKFELESTTIMKTRTVRDTHQVELLVTR